MDQAELVVELYKKIKLSMESLIKSNSLKNEHIVIFLDEVNANLMVSFYDDLNEEPVAGNSHFFTILNFLYKRDTLGEEIQSFEEIAKKALNKYIKQDFTREYSEEYTLWIKTDIDDIEEYY